MRCFFPFSSFLRVFVSVTAYSSSAETVKDRQSQLCSAIYLTLLNATYYCLFYKAIIRQANYSKKGHSVQYINCHNRQLRQLYYREIYKMETKIGKTRQEDLNYKKYVFMKYMTCFYKPKHVALNNVR